MAVRERLAEWPDLRFTVRPLPWSWRLRPWLYRDDVDGWRGHWHLEWLMLTVEWWANVPMFRLAPALSDECPLEGCVVAGPHYHRETLDGPEVVRPISEGSGQ